VVQVWDQPRRPLDKFLLLRHQRRVRVGFDGLCKVIREAHQAWGPERIYIEGEKLGQAAHDMLKDEMPIECLSTECADKATRAGPLVMKLERGEIFLPRHENSWRPGFEAELLAWTGDERQVADQIDAAAYAAIVVEQRGPQVIRMGSAVFRS
jgi:phage terminase large subunit-like protein